MDNNFKKDFGKRVAKLRNNNKMTQADLAEKLGLSVHGISLIETGRNFPSAETIEKILNVFSIAPQELFYFGHTATSAEMYSAILHILEKIKDDKDKITQAYLHLKSLI